MSFSIGEHFSDFIDQQLKEGRYSSASDVVRAGVRLLEEQEARLTALRAALIEGEQSGPVRSTLKRLLHESGPLGLRPYDRPLCPFASRAIGP